MNTVIVNKALLLLTVFTPLSLVAAVACTPARRHKAESANTEDTGLTDIIDKQDVVNRVLSEFATSLIDDNNPDNGAYQY